MFSDLQPSTATHPRWATGLLAMVFIGSSVLTTPAFAVPAPDAADKVVVEEVVETDASLDDGAPLQTTLRYTPTAGDHGVYTVNSGGKVSLKSDKLEMNTPIPTTVSTFSYMVEDVAEGGDFTTQTTLLDQGLVNTDDLDAELAEVMREALSETAGMAFVYKTSPLGVVTEAQPVGEVTALNTEDLTLMPNILYGTFLPEEPVGVGSTWQVESEILIGEASMEQLMTLEIVEMTQDTVTISAVHESLADPQAFADALFPAKENVNVLSMDFTGKGEFILDRSRGNRVVQSSITSSHSSSIEILSDDTPSSIMHQMYSMNVELKHQSK